MAEENIVIKTYEAFCEVCQHGWKAILPTGAKPDKLECPNCGGMFGDIKKEVEYEEIIHNECGKAIEDCLCDSKTVEAICPQCIKDVSFCICAFQLAE